VIVPFRIDVSDAVLGDLAARLARARLPRPPVLDGGESAETIERIEELVAQWRDGYDWRAQERRLNEYPQFRASVDGVGLHFLHVPGQGSSPLPLLLTNGWPSSFVEYLGVVRQLADPAAHGGDPADAFSVVVPALPGYGFSDRCLDRPLSRMRIAELFNRLMVDELGYSRYVAHGDDIGGGIVNRLGMNHIDSVVAIQTANWLRPYVGPLAPDLTEEELAYQRGKDEWDRSEGAYAHIQATRPQTLATGLNDSPVGLATWILEKFLTWSDPVTRSRMSAADLLTTVMIYWVTETIASSVRLYATAAPLGPTDVVGVPTSVVVPREPRLPAPPESWLRRLFPQLTEVVHVGEGGHFLALENPDWLVAEIRQVFRPLR
jgi:pimeloyl-ACP methyl ester carboxylesterase